MTRKSSPYSNAESALAQRLFAQATANGTLKPGRGLIAVAFGSGGSASASCAVTWRDYLPEARVILSRRPVGKGDLPKS